MKRVFGFISILILLQTTTAWGWWSVYLYSDSTHYKISKEAISALPESEYPDIQLLKFGQYIINSTSGPEDDANAHDGTTIPNGGRMDVHWNDALKQYKLFNFNSADGSVYYKIGSMLHLIEDQAVSAHAYNIRHGGDMPFDHMEEMVYNAFESSYKSAMPEVVSSSYYAENYQVMMDYTKNKISGSYWRKYWLSTWPDDPSNTPISYNVLIKGTPYTFEGVYAGSAINESDIYSRWDLFPRSWYGDGTYGDPAGQLEKDLTTDLLQKAVTHAAGALMAISKSLPALIKDLDITPSSDEIPVIDLQTGSQISFHLLENRTKNVKVFITVDSPDGDPIIETEYGVGKEIELSAGTDLPWEKDISITWDGKLSNGNYPSFGEHELYVRVEDADVDFQDQNGIEQVYATHKFTIQGPPYVVSTNPENNAVDVPASRPIEITFDHEMDTASVESAISISPAVTGEKSWSEDKKTITITPSPNMEAGTVYSVTVSDAAKDKDGSKLDGDKDGKAGGSYTFTFTFTTRMPPYVASTSPANNAVNIGPDSTIEITFDHEMDTTIAVDTVISISPAITGRKSWSADNKAIITPSSKLKIGTTYTVTVSDAVKDKDGSQLDGDKDGKAGGSYTFTFSTSANIRVVSLTHEYNDGSSYWVKAGGKNVTVQLVDEAGNAVASTTAPLLNWTSPGGTQPVNFRSGGGASTTWTGTIVVQSGSDGQATFSGEGTQVSGITSFMIDTIPPEIETISSSAPRCMCPEGPVAFEYNVTDSGSGVCDVTPVGLGLQENACYDPGTYTYGASPVTDNVGNSSDFSGSLSVLQNKCVNPDDNYSVIIQNMPGPSTSPATIAGKKIAVLGNGYVYAAQRFLADKVMTDSTIINADFSPDMYTEFPLLIIPTGGLSGLVQSDSFKARLASYVEKGGTILALSQNQGYEFEALPGGQVAGYGYSNDQQCFSNAAYINNWHQILSGQSKAGLDLNIDGFYTGLPAAGESILTRVSNGQSAMVVYQYGLGTVIATTMYTDWGYSVSQYTSQEISLIRDIVAWAKLPITLPEAGPGETVTTPTPVINETSNDGATIKVIIRDPSKNLVSELTSPTPLTAGESTEISIPYMLQATSPLGIWWINYEILDPDGHVIQSEQEASRFAVATRPENPAQQAGLSFSVLSDNENYLVGTNAEFTIMAFNSGTSEKTITARYDGHSQVVTVAPNSSASITYTKPITRANTRGALLNAYFYEDGTYLGSAFKRYWSSWPSATAIVRSDKAYYKKGENVVLDATVTTVNYADWQGTITLRIKDPFNSKIFEETKNIDLPADGSAVAAANFPLPESSVIGTYMVECDVWVGTSDITHASAKFELSQSRITVIPNPPAAFGTGNNTVPFVLTNTGTIAVSSGTLAVAMKDSAGNEVYRENQSFKLEIGETKTMNMLIPLQLLKKDSYTITYSQSDETRAGQESAINIPNNVIVTPTLDKTSYRIRETTNLSVDVKNTGKFNLDNLDMTVSVPDLGYLDTKTINLSAGQSALTTFVMPLPETLASGQHAVSVAATLPSGDSWTADSAFVVPPAELQPALNGQTFNIGDQLIMIVNNIGGVDSDDTYSIKLYDSTSMLVYEKTGNLLIQAGTADNISFPIPDTLMSDAYLLSAELLDGKTNHRHTLQQTITITGITSTIAVRTDKDIYVSTDQKQAIADIAIPSAFSGQGSLNLKALTSFPWFPNATSTGDAIIDTNVTRNMRNLSAGAEISNDYIDVVVAADGRLTINTVNGDPDNPYDGNAKLLYTPLSPWSSFTTAKVDDNYYKLGRNLAPEVTPYYDGSSIMTEWKIGNVRIIQKISIAFSDSGLPDTIQIEYIEPTHKSKNRPQTTVATM